MWNTEKHELEIDSLINKGVKSYIYQINELLGPKSYIGMPNYCKIHPHIIITPESYTIKNKSFQLMKTTKDLYTWYLGLVKKIGNRTESLVPIVDELISKAKTDEEKIKNIYYWVQDNIRYVAFEYGIMGFKPEDCQSVLNNKFGDCKGMANLTKEMLKLAGFDARLTWIGTNDLPYNYSLPSLVVDNHMICTVIHKGQYLFLDPTEKNSNLYENGARIQGKQALIEMEILT